MAGNIKGITIDIGGNTEPLERSLKDVNKTSRDLSTELRSVERLLKFDPSNVTAMAQKQDILTQQVANTTKKLDALKSAQQQVEQQFKDGEIDEGQYRAFNREIAFTENSLNKYQAELNKVQSEQNETGRSAEKLGKSFVDAGEKATASGQKMKDTGQQMATTMGASALAIGGALGFAVKSAADFDTAMRKAGAISGATAEEFEAMKAAALEMGSTTSLSASEVAEAMTELAAKGFDANQTIAAMPGIIAAAEASGESLALAADTVSSALNIWGLEASESSRVADVLAQTANASAASILDMQYALKYAGAPAKALGVSLEETSAAIALMVDAGMKGEQAGTTLRGALLGLLDPSEENSKRMNTMGIEITDAAGNFVGLSQLIENLQKSMEGQTDTQKAATIAALVGKEAVSGMLTLMDAGPAKIDAMTASLEDSGGASADAAKKMKAGIGGALENLSGAIDSFVIAVGDQLVPIIQKLANWLTELVNKFTALPDSMKTFLVIGTAIVGVVSAIGAVLGVVMIAIGSTLTVLGPLIAAIGQAGGIMAFLTTKLSFLGTLFTFLTGPVGIAIAAIAGVIAILVLAYNKVDWFREGVNSTWESIKQATSVAFGAIKQTIDSIVGGIVTFVKSQLDVFKAFWDENGAFISAGVKLYFGQIKDNIKFVMDIIKGIFQIYWPIISAVIRVAWESIKLVVSNGIRIVLGIIQTVLKLLQGDWKGAWNTILETVKDIWSNVGKFLKNIDLASTGRDIIQGLINGIGYMAKAVADKVKGIVDGIKSAITGALKIKSPSRVTMEYGVNVGQGLANGIDQMKSSVQRSADRMAQSAIPKKDVLDTGSKTATPAATPSLITGNHFIVREEADIKKIAVELHRLQVKSARGAFA